jgi:protein-tyrosine-phosphatase
MTIKNFNNCNTKNQKQRNYQIKKVKFRRKNLIFTMINHLKRIIKIQTNIKK